uniref:Epidermal growth factor receptor pathway substrate 15 like 1 n=1 Tax=Salarias fasciatus TaxID=181472 RepID=A0A672JT61_SALFA
MLEQDSNVLFVVARSRNTGNISAGDAAQFLKRSGLSDSHIWDLADSERRGYLDKRGFFVALRLVASAQGGNDISLNNLNQNLAAPKFPDEKGKFEGIFESLSPVNGLLPGEKVRPVLINSKLPLDVLGKIWDLSDVDKDGYLDKEEFIVAMHLVYRAMEKDPVPTTLPTSLIPPSKRKKSAVGLPGAVAVLPALSGLTPGSTPLKETLRSTPPLSSTTPLIPSAVSLSPQHSFKSPSQPSVNWAVPVADRERYDEIFRKTDSDNDGLVTGGEVIEIFMQSSLSQTMLAQIWGLADTKQTGKLSREQFSVAMYLIQQKVKKGIDPPSTLPPDLIPPIRKDSMGHEPGNKRARVLGCPPCLTQDMQNDLDREQDAQERLEEMDQQRSKLEGMLNDVKQKCIAALNDQEDDLSRTKADLSRLQEEAQLEQSLLSGRVQLDSIIKSLKTTQEEINQVGERERRLQSCGEDSLRCFSDLCGVVVKLLMTCLSVAKCVVLVCAILQDDSFKSRIAMFNNNSVKEAPVDPFKTEDPFKSDLFQVFPATMGNPGSNPSCAVGLALSADPFGGDPFKESDPFKGTSSEDFYKKTDKSDLFGSADPFGRKPTPPVKPSAFSSDPFSSNSTKQNSGMFVRVFDTLRLHIKSSEMHACVCACQQVVNSE